MRFWILSIFGVMVLAGPAHAKLGGTSSGGDDPTNVMECSAEMNDGSQLQFGFSDRDKYGFVGSQKVEFRKVQGEKVLAKLTILSSGHSTMDFDTGALLLRVRGEARKNSFELEILPVPEERNLDYYYPVRFYVTGSFFSGVKEGSATCKMYSKKAEPGSGGVEI